MAQELNSDRSLWFDDSAEDDDDEKEEDESQTFGLDQLVKRRCEYCKYSPLIPKIFENFTVLYCSRCKKPVCPQCRYPGLTLVNPSNAHTLPGLICTKCGTAYTHTSPQ